MVDHERRIRRSAKITMQPLLVLAHRLPYPPNRGDKIRSFHLLRWLSERYHVYLGTFYDDPDDAQYIDVLKPFVKQVYALPLSLPLWRKVQKTASAVATGQPVTLTCFNASAMHNWVAQTCREIQIESALAICSSMAPYLMNDGLTLKHRVIDFIDLDSDKWRQYQSQFRWPMSALYRREHKRLLAYEQQIAQTFDHHFFVSPQELQLFGSLTAQQYEAKGSVVANGIDSDYYQPCQASCPAAEALHQSLKHQRFIVFTGTMDATANIESVEWFLEHVWPSVKRDFPDLIFYVVGNKPTTKVLSWQASGSVVVTGGVADVRPYLQYSQLAVAPMRLARGVQNKVLEAMAMAKPVSLSQRAAEGLRLPDEQKKRVAISAEQMVESIAELLTKPQLAKKIGETNRIWVQQKYSWASQLNGLKTIMSGDINDRL